MVNQHDITETMRNLQVPDDIQELVNGIVSGIIALAARAANSNSDYEYSRPNQVFKMFLTIPG